MAVVATIVLGLDGANWNLIDPWLESGDLPNIRTLREQGIWGVSNSVLPPVTCPNWKCYASSQPPGAHDVYWWEKVDKDTMSIDVPDSKSFGAPELWDYLNDEGLSAGVINLPMSYPPRAIDEFMIGGGPRSREEDYTYPTEMENEIEREFGYRVHPRNVVTSGQERNGVEATLDLIETRFETAHQLLERRNLDFLHLTIFHLNVLQHYYWKGEPVESAWKLIDEQIGSFLDEDHTIFLMSDHGCDEIETVFYINEWLQAEGYLTLKTTAADYLMKAGITQERLANFVRAFGLEPTIRKYLPRRLIERFPDQEGIKRDNKFDKVDIQNSVAIASGQGLIYLLADPASSQYEMIRSDLMNKIDSLTTKQETPVAAKVRSGADLYPEGDPEYRPDIVFEQSPGIHTSGAVGKGHVLDEPGQWAAENVRGGLFLAQGGMVAETGNIDSISILDIAPSVLYSMGLDIPEGFRGVPVKETNTDREGITNRASLPDRGGELAGDGEDVRERLTDLGYLE